MSSEKAIKQRGGHRSRAKQLMLSIDTALKTEPSSQEELAGLVLELKRQKAKIEELDDLILGEVDDKQIESEVEKASSWAMDISRVLAKCEIIIQNSPKQISTTKTVKLPDIKLEKFSGDPLQWTIFWDMFRTSIHDRKDLAIPAKFHYLLSQLEGEAAKLLSGFENTSAEYSEAIELLQTTYGKPKTLIKARLNALFDLKSPQPNSSSLSDFRATYEGHLRALKSLGTDTVNSGFVFAELLLRKLPSETRDHINRAHKSEHWDLPDLRRAIDEEINLLYAAKDVTKESNVSNFDHIEIHDKPSSAAFHTTTRKKSDPKCFYCQQSHATYSCPNYSDTNSRKARVKQLKLCFNCLRNNHSVNSCTNSGRCRSCGRKHHTSLCYQSGPVADEPSANPAGGKTTEKSTQRKVSDSNNTNPKYTSYTIHSNTETSKFSSILPTAILTLIIDQRTFSCRALFDTGSQRTFIHKNIATNLSLETVKSTTLCVDGFGSRGSRKTYDIVNLSIKCNAGTIEIEAIVTDSMPSRLTMPGRSSVVKDLLERGFNLADPTTNTDNFSDTPLLIGMDNYAAFMYHENVGPNLFVMPSRVGNLLGGCTYNENSTSNITTVLRVGSVDCQNTADDLSMLWDLERMGIELPDSDDNAALDNFRKSISYSKKQGRYIASLPWKNDCPDLPTNRDLSLKRVSSLLRSLSKDSHKLKTYDDLIKQQLDRDFIEIVDENELPLPESRIHYIPHHAVAKDSITTPIRIVYNCSAKASKHRPSLNECLYTGPSLVNDLLAVLLRFRLNKYAVTSDIEKAFLMVGLNPRDKDSCRFFWPRDPFDPNSPLLTYRFKVVLFGSTASQFLLNSTIHHHLAKMKDQIANSILRNIYIDNVNHTCDTEPDLLNFYSKAKAVMKAGGFSLREWHSNSRGLREVSSVNSDLGKQTHVKLLGVFWSSNLDCLTLSLPIESNENDTDTITKRTVVREQARFFDPFGFSLPVTITGKIFIQTLWKSDLKWDEPLSTEQVSEWENIKKQMVNFFSKFTVPRMFLSRSNIKLHVFADASIRSYGAVGYFLSSSGVDFVLAKSRVAPIKSPTLPQLELTAVSVAARLAKFILTTFCDELVVESIFIWTDSQITHHWLRSDKVLKPYVRQRVLEVKRLLPSAQIMLVPGTNNPADLLTRGISANVALSSSLWRSGPGWLENEQWPEQPCTSMTVLTEIQTDCNISCKNSNEPIPIVQIPVENYNTYLKAIFVTFCMLKFIHKSRKSVHDATSLTIRRAELRLIEHFQRVYYSDIFAYFANTSTKKPPLVRQLNLYFDNVIRCQGRIDNSKLSSYAKRPILLPGKSPLTRLIIQDFHVRYLHAGVNETLAALRSKFWLPQARCQIKRILKKCTICLKVEGRSFPVPPISDLPHERVNQSRPFQITGVDLTGAIFVKVAGQCSKAYIVLFTCAVTRAVHLEIVSDVSVREFISAFVRFVSRRSYPQIMYSDNATNFVSASKILRTIANHQSVVNTMNYYHVQWKFSTPRAPWQGGIWERLIGMMKSSFKKIVGNALLTLTELTTLVVQIESKMNDRPLTYVSGDLHDLEPITPSMLLFGYRINSFPITMSPDELSDPSFMCANELSKRHKYLQLMLSNFWGRWHTEYLTTLREHYFRKTNGVIRSPKIGEVVQIHGENARVNWRLGVITGLINGRDGIVRSVSLRTSSGHLLRPVSKLYPIEVAESPALASREDHNNDQINVRTKIQRKAAIEALHRIKNCN